MDAPERDDTRDAILDCLGSFPDRPDPAVETISVMDSPYIDDDPFPYRFNGEFFELVRERAISN